MKLQIVPARPGVQWVRQGFQVFFRRPLAFSGLFAGFLFAALVVLVLPFIGSLLLLALLPLVTLGFMIATRATLQGGVPLPGVFVAPFRGGRARTAALVRLGVIYAAGSVVVMLLSNMIDGGAFNRLQEVMGARELDREHIEALLASPRLQIGMLVRAGLAALLSVPFWHAPALVHWGDQGALKSLFFSTVAIWRNKGAFLVYSLAWAGVIVVFSVLANIVFWLLGQPQLMAYAAMPAGLIFSTAFYASLYFTFIGCFSPEAGTAA